MGENNPGEGGGAGRRKIQVEGGGYAIEKNSVCGGGGKEAEKYRGGVCDLKKNRGGGG